MPIISIISQPSVDDLKAAYRPITFKVNATRTDGNAAPPIVYCDIYVNDVFYKSAPKSQYETLNATDSTWKFDIMDACQEILKAMLPANGGTDIVEATTVMAKIYCKFRSSGFDANGFLVAEGTAPAQGTGSTDPVSGTGTQSNSFYAANTVLQHEQNQSLPSHLGYYKSGTWDANVYPLTHRPANYKVCKGDSDFFPIVNLSDKTPLCIKIFYKNKGDSAYSSASKCGAASCTAVSIPAFTLSDAIAGTAYSRSIPLSGTAPFTIGSFSSPAAWLSADIVGSDLVFSGTPAAGDVGSNIAVNVVVNNACGSDSAYKTINVVSSCTSVGISGSPLLDDAYSDQAYYNTIILTGSAPFSLSAIVKPAWMTIAISDNEVVLSGTPAVGDVATGVNISFTVSNGCGSVDYADTIDVIQSGTRFGSTTFNSSDALTDYETANIIGGQPGATVTITLDTLTNNNGGQVKVNGIQAFQGNTWNFVCDGSGNLSFDVDIIGLNHPSTAILAHFTITAVTSGTIGTPNTFQTSKAF